MQGKDVIVLRTFSKAYGMAGLRMGMALGRPDLPAKMMPHRAGSFLPMPGVVTATARIKSAGLVPAWRAANAKTREMVFNFLAQKKFNYVPSTTNFFMLEANRPSKELVMADEGKSDDRPYLAGLANKSASDDWERRGNEEVRGVTLESDIKR